MFRASLDDEDDFPSGFEAELAIMEQMEMENLDNDSPDLELKGQV